MSTQGADDFISVAQYADPNENNKRPARHAAKGSAKKVKADQTTASLISLEKQEGKRATPKTNEEKKQKQQPQKQQQEDAPKNVQNEQDSSPEEQPQQEERAIEQTQNTLSTRQKRKLKARAAALTLKQRALEHSLFGNPASLLQHHLGEEINNNNISKQANKETSKKKKAGKSQDNSNQEHGAAAWVDDDDEKITVDVKVTKQGKVSAVPYQERLKLKFQRTVVQSTAWANARETATDFDDGELYDGVTLRELNEELLTSTGSLVTSSKKGTNGGILPPRELELVRLKDANQQARGASQVTSVRFQPGLPSSQLLLAASSAAVRLFQIDGVNNNLVQTVKLSANSWVLAADFDATGQEVIFTCRTKKFYIYDIASSKVSEINNIIGKTGPLSPNTPNPVSAAFFDVFSSSPDGTVIAFVGSHGTVVLISARSKQWIGDLKVNGHVRALTFSRDSSLLYVAAIGQVYVFDMKTRRCLHSFSDNGSVGTTSIAASSSLGDTEYLACGQESGIVSLYNSTELFSSAAPRPVHEFQHLTTTVNNIAFNHDSQIMAMSSTTIPNALKLVHVPSRTVFANFPAATTKLDRVRSLAFSADSRYAVFASTKGVVQLYQLPFYS